MNRRTKAGLEEVDAIEAAGFHLLKPEAGSQIKAMPASLRNHKRVGGLLKSGSANFETSINWFEDVGGQQVLCKARLDYIDHIKDSVRWS